jgi:hypothetical protein
MSDKVLAYGDQHMRATSSFLPWNVTTLNGLTRETNNLLLGYDFVADRILHHRPEKVVNLGDIFHPTAIIAAEVLDAAGRGIARVAEACHQVGAEHIIIPGNHDCYSLTPRIISIRPFGGYGRIINEPELNIHDSFGPLVYIPYMEDDELYQAFLKYSACGKCIIFCHQELPGAVYENGRAATCMVEPPAGHKIISGHIHMFQAYNNVVYVGSLVQNRFSNYEIKTMGVAIINTRTGEVTPELNTYSKHYVACKSVNDAFKFDPKQVVLKIFTDEDKDTARARLDAAGFEYMLIRPPKVKEGGKVISVDGFTTSPTDLLRTYVATNKPEYLDIYDKHQPQD